MALGNLPVSGRPTILDNSRARAYCACSRCGLGLFGHLSLVYPFSSLSPSLWETARYRLKYCLKGPLNPNQPTNQNHDLSAETEHFDHAQAHAHIQRGYISPPLLRKDALKIRIMGYNREKKSLYSCMRHSVLTCYMIPESIIKYFKWLLRYRPEMK